MGATMGGWIAGLFAYESPNRVDKLVMTGNPGFHGAANNRLAQFEVPSEDRVRQANRARCKLPQRGRTGGFGTGEAP